jgi:hypothetical protein
MGFHKRFITKDLVLSQKSFEDIEKLLSADALIFDTWSSNFYKRLDENFEEYQNKRLQYIEDNKFSSSFRWPNNVAFDASTSLPVITNSLVKKESFMITFDNHLLADKDDR